MRDDEVSGAESPPVTSEEIAAADKILAAFPGAIPARGAAELMHRRRLALVLRKWAPGASDLEVARAAAFIHVRSFTAGRAPSAAMIDAQIRRVDEAADEMIAALGDMWLDTRMALTEASVKKLEGLALRVGWTLNFKSVNPTVRPSRVRKPSARAASIQAVRHYEALTGRKATVITPSGGGKAGSPFMDFLSEVFEALAISGSLESQAKAAKRAWATMEKEKRESGS